MTILLSRRQSLAGGLLALPVLAGISGVGHAADDNSGEAQLAALESKHPGRICVSILNMASGKRLEHRAGERILMCSTFKALLAALVLARVDKGEERLDRRIRYTKSDLVSNSPATEANVGNTGMTVAELCAATINLSDNAAANLLLANSGGPKAVTAFCRSLGDEITRLDRIEPELNVRGMPDDQRDTTTATAMLENLRRLLFADVLTPASRSQLAAWLIMTKTGDARLRAGLPKDWLVGDKTGTNGDKFGNANDIAVLWPSNRAPIIVTAYCEIPGIAPDERNAVIAEIGRIAAAI